MSTFQQMQNDIQLLSMGGMITTDIGSLLNMCQRQEVESWDWSFLYTNVIINTVIPSSAGTVQVQNGALEVFGTGTSFPTTIGGWWFRTGATLTTPVIVKSFLTPTQLVLSAPWGGASASGQPYTLFPLYYSVYPLIEVQRVRQIDFLTETSQEALNRIDPSRVSTGGAPSLRWAPAPWLNVTTQGQFQVELWPVPTGQLPYIVDGKSGPIDMVEGTDLPQIPTAVLENKAMMYLALATFASNGNPKWAQIAASYKVQYEYERDAARLADNRRKVTLGISASGDASNTNLGMDYLYSHDPAGPPYVGGAQ